MILLDSILVPCGHHSARIELHHGDLTEIDPADAVDVLVVSAFPGDYSPTHGSLIGALHAKGVSVEQLAQTPAVDLRTVISCWLSEPITAVRPGLRFVRILCFESLRPASPGSYIGDIFRALAPFVADRQPVKSIAMPLLTTGDQGYPMEELLPALLDAAWHWLSNGLSLNCIKIVVRSAEKTLTALALFRQCRARLVPAAAAAAAHHDIFISYSRRDGAAAEAIRDDLRSRGLSTYFDKQSMDVGVAWQQHIYAALEACTTVLALYSPAYIASKVCQEEFNMALFRSRRESRQLLFPVYWQTAQLPVYMDMVNHLDCRECRQERIREVGDALAAHRC